MAIYGHPKYGKMVGKIAKLITLVLIMRETWFWCLSPGFWAWEIHWDHFQTPQIGLTGQIVIYGHLKYGNMTKLITLVLIMWETWFWCLPPVFGHRKSIGAIFKHLKLAIGKYPQYMQTFGNNCRLNILQFIAGNQLYYPLADCWCSQKFKSKQMTCCLTFRM